MYGIILPVLYVLAVLLPLIMILILGLGGEHGLLFEIGRAFALCAFVIIALQPVLTARLKWIERPFGMDILSRFHKATGLLAALLLLAHPLLLAIGGAGLQLILSIDLPWYVLVGKGTLVLLIIQAVLGIYWERLGLTFESWRKSHYVLAPIIVAAAFLHSWVTGDDLEYLPLQVYWVLLLASAVSAFVYQKVIKPGRLRRHPYTVSSVTQETHDVWTVTLTPPDGESVYPYLPGQFHFLTFHRDPSLPVEEHHWTISSSPSTPGIVSSTIKESGDFTKTIGKTKVGDTAAAEGAFGRFSYLLHPEDTNIVFIAGGIGITPIMAMLRHMSDTGATLPVLLIYANRTERDIVFRREIANMETSRKPYLMTVHVLSQPDDSWEGERGYVTEDLIRKHCGRDLKNRSYYVCGPPVMAEKVIGALREQGVPDARIRAERFSL